MEIASCGTSAPEAACTSNTISFTTPFHTNFRMTQSAHLVIPAKSDGDPAPAVKWTGVESMTVENGGDGDFNGNVEIAISSHCWGKNLESRYTSGAAFGIFGSFQCELRDSYLHTANNPEPGGSAYAIEVDSYSADNLVENNIVWNFNKMDSMRSSGGGNVIAYNYMEDGYGSSYPHIVEIGLNSAHMAGAHYELFEGNQCFNFDNDSGFGNQIYMTVFRNHFTTLRRSLGYGTADGVKVQLTDAGNRRAIALNVDQWWHSFVGNVLGYPDGYLQYPSPFSPEPQASIFKYEWLGASPPGEGYTPMWQLGYDGDFRDKPQDMTVVDRTLRDANFDYFTKAVHWHGIGGTGVGQTTPLPGTSTTLPQSLYLTSKPAFFGTNTWPWVDGSTATDPLPGILPARARFDAGTPNDVP